MNDRVRIGVIGVGSIGLEHCRSLAQRVAGSELAAAADTNETAVRRASELSDRVFTTADYEELLADPSIQAVVIATPNDTHARLVEEAAEAGKDVFCEKPLGLDLASVDAALAAVSRNEVKLQVGFQRRFDRSYREARRLIAAGDIGSVELVVGTTRDPAPPPPAYLERSGSFFVDTAIHDYDSLRFLTGLEVTEVFAEGSSMHLEGEGDAFLDTAVTSLRLETGALAVITNRRRTTYGCEVTMEVSGSKGRIDLGQERGATQGVAPDHFDSFWQRFEEAYVEELAHFTKCVALDQAPDVSGEDGRRALEIALLAERSAREGRPLSIG